MGGPYALCVVCVWGVAALYISVYISVYVCISVYISVCMSVQYISQWWLLVFQRGEAHFRPTSYKL